MSLACAITLEVRENSRSNQDRHGTKWVSGSAVLSAKQVDQLGKLFFSGKTLGRSGASPYRLPPKTAEIFRLKERSLQPADLWTPPRHLIPSNFADPILCPSTPGR